MKTHKDTKAIVFSKRTRVRLPQDEFKALKDYIDADPAAYATITHNTAVRRTTVMSLLENGYTELQTASRLKPFITVLKKTKLQG